MFLAYWEPLKGNTLLVPYTMCFYKKLLVLIRSGVAYFLAKTLDLNMLNGSLIFFNSFSTILQLEGK